MTLAEVLAGLSAHAPVLIDAGPLRRSAVLVPLLEDCDGRGPGVLLTRRAEGIGLHSGQVSFPGGHVDPSDGSPEVTALRETEEELGIAREYVRVVHRLDDVMTATGFHVAQIIGVLDAAAPMRPSPREVARVFTVPLVELREAQRWRQVDHPYQGSTFRVWHFDWAGEDVWGATAYMLRGMTGVLGWLPR